MSNVLAQDQIPKGEYKITLESLNSKQYENIIDTPISIIEKQKEYGLSANINQIDGIASDKIQIINQNEEANRSIKIKYSNSSELKNMKIKIKAVERTGEFEYKETTNSSNKINIDTTEIETISNNIEQDINITFESDLKQGTYRILVEMYDEYEQLRTYDYVNFIVD